MLCYKKERNSVLSFVVRAYHLLLLVLAIFSACITVGLSCLFKKAWTRDGRAREDEFFLFKLFKSILALIIILFMVVTIIFSNILSFMMKHLDICRRRARKKGRHAKAFLVGLIDVFILSLFTVFSSGYNLGCFFWDRFDEK